MQSLLSFLYIQTQNPETHEVKTGMVAYIEDSKYFAGHIEWISLIGVEGGA